MSFMAGENYAFSTPDIIIKFLVTINITIIIIIIINFINIKH